MAQEVSIQEQHNVIEITRLYSLLTRSNPSLYGNSRASKSISCADRDVIVDPVEVERQSHEARNKRRTTLQRTVVG